MGAPRLIEFGSVHDDNGGSLSFVESHQLPFDVQRVYWIYGVKKGDHRGGHAHKSSDRLLVCTSGSADIQLENSNGEKFTFELQNPSQGLFFPANHWVDIKFHEKSVLMVLVSCTYNEDEYLKDYDQFLSQ